MNEQRACIFTDCRKFGTCQRKDNCYLAKTDEQRKAEADEAFSKYPVGKTLVPETDAEKIERLTNFVTELQQALESANATIKNISQFKEKWYGLRNTLESRGFGPFNADGNHLEIGIIRLLNERAKYLAALNRIYSAHGIDQFSYEVAGEALEAP